MIKTRSVTTGKFEKNSISEDAAIARKNLIAVSDGAGGGGLFADRWSKYLLQYLPDTPFTTADELDEWIGSIWEKFYNRSEESAKRIGGLALDKFYDEGSFATLAAVWETGDDTCSWMAYGDSVVFHYDYATKQLHHSFTSLKDFNHPPYLINCKDELNKEGFRCGSFSLNEESFIFLATDALSHYILMMYEISRMKDYADEIQLAISANTKNSNLLEHALMQGSFNFEKKVIEKLRHSAYDRNYFKKWLANLIKKGLLAHDDYSLAVMYKI